MIMLKGVLDADFKFRKLLLEREIQLKPRYATEIWDVIKEFTKEQVKCVDNRFYYTNELYRFQWGKSWKYKDYYFAFSRYCAICQDGWFYGNYEYRITFEYYPFGDIKDLQGFCFSGNFDSISSFLAYIESLDAFCVPFFKYNPVNIKI